MKLTTLMHTVKLISVFLLALRAPLLGDESFCVGINQFVFHRYTHQPWNDRKPGMSMGPWGIIFDRANTSCNQGADWIEYISRCQVLLQRGRFAADLCYFYGEATPNSLIALVCKFSSC